MGKNGVKNKMQTGKAVDSNVRQSNNSSKSNNSDMALFVSMSRELKEEGNKLFQRRDLEGAMERFEKALELLPKNHADVCHLRSNLAACYMQMGLSQYPRAIHECNLALEVAPKNSKALLKRARCYEALNRLELALRDVNTVLETEPNNIMALEISERVQKKQLALEYVQAPEVVKEKSKKKSKKKIDKATMDQVRDKKVDENVDEKKAEDKLVVEEIIGDKTEEPNKTVKLIFGDDIRCAQLPLNCSLLEKQLPLEYVQAPKVVKEKRKKKNKKKTDKAAMDQVRDKKVDENVDEKKAEDKLVVEEVIGNKTEESKKTVKLIFGDDIRCARLPLNCSLLQLREVIRERFPSSRAVLIKYRDEEGDLVTVTSDEELRFAEVSAESRGSLRLYVVENGDVGKVKEERRDSCCIDDWIIEFAQLFKNYVGFDSNAYLTLHELGMKEYSEAMEETVTSEEAQDLFDRAAEKFKELTALASFNWGNVHMSRARKRLYTMDDGSRESVFEQIKTAYDWAQFEYIEAGKKYEEALRTKPDFYEALLALGKLRFEQAKLSWYYAIGNDVDLRTWPSENVLQLYNDAEENMEKGTVLWEEVQVQRLHKLSDPKKEQSQMHKVGNDISADEVAEQADSMSVQINLLWGTILYERSIMEFKLGLPDWQECLEVAVEKFEHAGASPTDIAVMVKNHCSNNNVLEGLGFKIDEIIQAWNEMHEAKNWQSKISSFRLEPLLRRRVSKIYHALELQRRDCY